MNICFKGWVTNWGFSSQAPPLDCGKLLLISVFQVPLPCNKEEDIRAQKNQKFDTSKEL